MQSARNDLTQDFLHIENIDFSYNDTFVLLVEYYFSSMFVDFSKYLETQRELASQHKNRLKLMKKKQEKADESDEEETSVKRLKEKVKNKLSKRKNPLDMNILFPKKKAKKPKLGTRESDDPR